MKVTASRFNPSQMLLKLAIALVLLLNIFIFVKLAGGFPCAPDKVASSPSSKPLHTIPVSTGADDIYSGILQHISGFLRNGF